MINEIIIHEEQYDYLSPDFSLRGNPVFRIEIKGVEGRYYATFDEDNHPIILSSGTTIIGDGLPDKMKEVNLSNWRTRHVVQGNKPADETRFAQDYGTILHALYGKLLRGDTIAISTENSFFALEMEVRALGLHIAEDSLKFIFATRIEELKKDIMSFITWIHTHEVDTLAVELMGASLKRRAGTAIDHVGIVTAELEGYWSKTKAGKWSKSKRVFRIPAVTDFKSGKKGFFDSYVLQLKLSDEILMEQYSFETYGMFNFAPTAWRGTKPGFNFKFQNNSPALLMYESVMQTGLQKFLAKPKKHKFFTGQASINPELNSLQYIEVPLLETLYDRYRPELKAEYLERFKFEQSEQKKNEERLLMEFSEKVAEFNKDGAYKI